MHVHKMTSLYYFLCHMQSADQCTVDDNMISLDCYSLLQSIIALAFDHCTCGQCGNFHGYRTSQDQRGGSTDPFHGGPWRCLPQISARQPPHETCKIWTKMQL